VCGPRAGGAHAAQGLALAAPGPQDLSRSTHESNPGFNEVDNVLQNSGEEGR